MVLVFGNVQSKAGNERVVETFCFFIRLRMIGFPGASLHPEERTKHRKEFAFKLRPIVRQQVVW